MKRFFKKTLFIICLMLFVIPAFQVYAQSNMKIETKSYIVTGTRKEAKFKTNKGYAYCITPDRIGAGQGATLTYMSSENKGGVLYLLEKAGTSDHDYLVTQLAIWIYKSNYMPDYYVNNSSIEVVKSAKALAAEASKKGNYTDSVPNFNITTTNSNLELTSDGKYYKSGVITISSVNNKDKVKVELVDSINGAQLNKIESNDNTLKYEVVVPASNVTTSKTFKVKATETYTANKVERYTPGDGHQDLVVLVPENKTVSKEVSLTVTPVVRKCEYYNNQYYGSDGSVVSKEVYETQCLHKCEKVGDKYYDQDGNVTTEENYKIQCFKHTCEKIGDKYFGNQGFEVSETEYIKQCLHICEIYNNEYYDSKGYKVDEAEYKKQCEASEVVVPDTGTNATQGIAYVLIGSVLLGTVMGYLEYKNKNVMNTK